MRRRKTLLRAGLGLALVLVLGIAAIAVAGGNDSSSSEEKRKGDDGARAAQADAAQLRQAQKRKARKKARGFKALPARFQKRGSMGSIRPKPKGKYSRNDRGPIWDRDCMVQPPDTKGKPCIFGRKKSKTKVALFGDSHAMHLFGAVERLAKRRGWKLIAQTKAGCGPLTVPVFNNKVNGAYRQCLKWHKHALKRIEQAKPKIIIVGVALSHKPMRNGRIISNEKQKNAALVAGYREMLQRLLATGARVIAIRDLPKAPHDVTDCVAANLKKLKRCSFRKPKNYGKTWESRAVKGVDGVREVDLSRAMCTKRRCFGVVRNELVYRDNDHMTYTFSRTVAPWLARGLDR